LRVATFGGTDAAIEAARRACEASVPTSGRRLVADADPNYSIGGLPNHFAVVLT
jgi:hypothetical protein